MEQEHRELQSFRLRLPPDLHETLKERAWRERKSLNHLLLEMARAYLSDEPKNTAAGA